MPGPLFVKKLLFGGKNRSGIEIAAAILTDAKEPKKITHLMYAANLSYELIHKYKDVLIANGLLEQSEVGKFTVYETTHKGKEFLKHVEDLKGMVREVMDTEAAIEMDLVDEKP